MTIRQKIERLLRQVSYLRFKGFKLYADDLLNGKRTWSLETEFSSSDKYPQSVSGSSERYLSIVDRANNNPDDFLRFRSNLQYMTILEHVDRALGAEYWEIIQKYRVSTKKLFKYIKNDLCGPSRFTYQGIGRVSPTNLRYAKVCLDIEALFGSTSKFRIAEIGVGFGGQCAALYSHQSFSKYTLFDLPPVLNLTGKYLDESEVPKEKVEKGKMVNSYGAFDLVISNYAFSELSRELQEEYLEKVILKSAKGYVIYNDFTGDGLSPMEATEFANRLPNGLILEEFPETHPNNCLVIWGEYDLSKLQLSNNF